MQLAKYILLSKIEQTKTLRVHQNVNISTSYNLNFHFFIRNGIWQFYTSRRVSTT